MPEKLARSVVVTPCCRHHSLTERPLLRHSWICAAHSCRSARCFNSALVILTSHNTTVAKPFATFRYYCLMCVYARLGLTVTTGPLNSVSETVKYDHSLSLAVDKQDYRYKNWYISTRIGSPLSTICENQFIGYSLFALTLLIHEINTLWETFSL